MSQLLHSQFTPAFKARERVYLRDAEISEVVFSYENLAIVVFRRSSNRDAVRKKEF